MPNEQDKLSKPSLPDLSLRQETFDHLCAMFERHGGYGSCPRISKMLASDAEGFFDPKYTVTE
jgi:hypothetical protein